jgi:hypothetical protein
MASLVVKKVLVSSLFVKSGKKIQKNEKAFPVSRVLYPTLTRRAMTIYLGPASLQASVG